VEGKKKQNQTKFQKGKQGRSAWLVLVWGGRDRAGVTSPHKRRLRRKKAEKKRMTPPGGATFTVVKKGTGKWDTEKKSRVATCRGGVLDSKKTGHTGWASPKTVGDGQKKKKTECKSEKRVGEAREKDCRCDPKKTVTRARKCGKDRLEKKKETGAQGGKKKAPFREQGTAHGSQQKKNVTAKGEKKRSFSCSRSHQGGHPDQDLKLTRKKDLTTKKGKSRGQQKPRKKTRRGKTGLVRRWKHIHFELQGKTTTSKGRTEPRGALVEIRE